MESTAIVLYKPPSNTIIKRGRGRPRILTDEQREEKLRALKEKQKQAHPNKVGRPRLEFNSDEEKKEHKKMLYQRKKKRLGMGDKRGRKPKYNTIEEMRQHWRDYYKNKKLKNKINE